VATQMFGWSPAQAVGRLLTETVIPRRHHESHAQGLARMAQGVDTDILGKLKQWSACRADGTEISVELMVTPVHLEGGLNYIVFVRDITARRQAEERLRDRSEQLNAILSMSPDAFVSFDRARGVTSVNPAFVRMTGLVESELLGLDEFAFLERLSRICVPEKNSRSMGPLRAIKQAGAEGTAVPGVHKRLQRIELANTGKRVLEVALRESNSATVSQILYLHDVTHETEVERLKSEFVSNAAHELRT
ncbi:MAG: PAS domain S-box protein, partial [Proteobacteria bacterium]|nr:PAS domain S-box protein [Pseudomonadota bacterium]